MKKHTFDAITRQAAVSLSRRGSLLTVGGAGLAALAGSSAAGKKKHRKARKCKKKCEKKVQQSCQSLEGECNGFFVPLCEEEGSPEECLEQIGACCTLLGDCQAGEFLACFMEIVRPRPEDR